MKKQVVEIIPPVRSETGSLAASARRAARTALASAVTAIEDANTRAMAALRADDENGDEGQITAVVQAQVGAAGRIVDRGLLLADAFQSAALNDIARADAMVRRIRRPFMRTEEEREE